jgi:hypothetical protein
LILLAAAPALAEEIIYFTNGTSMPIRAHEVRGDMIHVDLGSDAFMAFPMYMVDKIEDAGKSVALTPSFSAGNKIMSGRKPTPDGNYPVTGHAPGRNSNALSREPRLINKSEMYDEEGENFGVKTNRPLAGHRAANRRGLGTTGRVTTAAESKGQEDGGYYGTTKQGSRNVIGKGGRRATQGGVAKKPTPLNLNRSSGGASKNK